MLPVSAASLTKQDAHLVHRFFSDEPYDALNFDEEDRVQMVFKNAERRVLERR